MVSDASLTPEQIEAHAFTTGFRGYDHGEVRSYLRRLAAELRELRERSSQLESAWHSAEERAARPPVLDEDTLMAAVGEETASILRSARAAAADLRTKAAEEAQKALADAQAHAAQIQEEAKGVLARETMAAEEAATRIIDAARSEAAETVAKAQQEADSIRAKAEQERVLTLEGANATRERILEDLSRRRRVATVQIEQLRAGRERLIESYAVVRRTLEEAQSELSRADAEARAAADEVGRRLRSEDPEPVPAATGAVVDLSPAPADPEEPAAEATVAEEPAGDRPPADKKAGRRLPFGRRNGAPAPAPAAGGSAVAVSESDGESESETVAAPEQAAARSDAGDAGAADAADGADLGVTEPGPGPESESEPDPVSGPVSGPALAAEPVPTAAATKPAAGSAVEELFAKLRSAHETTAAEPEATEAPADKPVSDADEALLQKRESAIVDLEVTLTRKLKRALQDEQNDLLDRLRGLRGEVTAARLLPELSDQATRYVEAATPIAEQAASAGARFAADTLGAKKSKAGGHPTVADLVGEAGHSIVEPLRRRLEQAVDTSAGEDQAVLVESLGAAYREWKSQRVERVAGDLLSAAFARGTWEATPAGVTVRWIVEDVDGPCPDCDDDALAGTLPKEEAFPTGQHHPPAHSGCRCLLVPTAS